MPDDESTPRASLHCGMTKCKHISSSKCTKSMESRKRGSEVLSTSGGELPGNIEIGKKYKLRLSSEPKTIGLHYTFKPANVDTSADGILSIADRNEAVVLLQRDGNANKETYKGTIDESDKTLHLSFDPTDSTFQLKKIGLMVNQLKYREVLNE